jgi:hypothetical protein
MAEKNQRAEQGELADFFFVIFYVSDDILSHH